MEKPRDAGKPDPSGYELELFPSESAPAPTATPRSMRLWATVAVLALLAAAAAYVAFVWRPHRASTTATTSPSPAAQAPAALGGQPEPIAVPPLDASDPIVRTLVRELSDSPAVAAWLTTNGLIRNFTVVVTNVADGATPSRHLAVLRPRSAFRVVESDGSFRADPRGYDRYAKVAEAVDSIDPAGAAKLYATLKPRIEEAGRDLGNAEPFDRTLERAIVTLLETPAIDGTEALRPAEKGIGYVFADDRLETLPAAQKQLLRMGPTNARIVKTKLREIALALGIPASRLPAR